MSNEINFVQARQTEDLLQESVLGRPTIYQHHANPVKDSDSLIKKLWASRDLLDQTHSDILDSIKYGLKASIFGGSIGTAFYVTHLYDESTFVNRKAFTYADNHSFGHAKIFWKFSRRFFYFGALTGVAWNFWWNILLTNHEPTNDLTTHVIGYGLFAGGALGIYHPRMFLTGALMGGVYGLLAYSNIFAQSGADKTRMGFAYELPNSKITQEQKDLQRIKDQILYLGQVNIIRNHSLKEI